MALLLGRSSSKEGSPLGSGENIYTQAQTQPEHESPSSCSSAVNDNFKSKANTANNSTENSNNKNKDYDLSTPLPSNGHGLRQSLTSYGDAHFSLFMRKLFIKAMGFSEDALSRPIIGIVNTYSAFNPCHANIPHLIDAVKRGVQLNGGLAMDFPTISLHESFAAPTSMYLRNLMSMDTEEMVRGQPVDAVILIGGECDSKGMGGQIWRGCRGLGFLLMVWLADIHV